MNNWLNPLFLVPTLTGLIFIVAAIITSKYPPKNINSVYGYRTKRSMLSKERWDFAQEYSNNLMSKYGIILIFFGFLGYFTSFLEVISTIISVALIVVLVLALFSKTERAIREKFDVK